ncbi:hypothetical protein KSZ_67380 [Dictyobacter formicarum]|uniref:Uncharacterized protein n=1 Tax=Dictyobacter formicarum TaxID=2778368 RepID=A0ABQ3VS84_9CHLR|nr:hypothetical protein KSZ_67380 [Dictyobacter formicarum]
MTALTMAGLAQTDAASFIVLFTAVVAVAAGAVEAVDVAAGVAVTAGLAGVLFFACANGG